MSECNHVREHDFQFRYTQGQPSKWLENLGTVSSHKTCTRCNLSEVYAKANYISCAGRPEEPKVGPPFSAQAVADGYWEFYHDDDCDEKLIISPDGRSNRYCPRCGFSPDMQSQGARRTDKLRAEAIAPEPAICTLLKRTTNAALEPKAPEWGDVRGTKPKPALGKIRGSLNRAPDQQEGSLSTKAMFAAEKLVENLQEYLRSGLGTPKTTVLISPLLDELQELRQYFYNIPVLDRRQ